MYILGKVSEVAGKVLEVCSRKGFTNYFECLVHTRKGFKDQEQL